jgi:hypothetical protein
VVFVTSQASRLMLGSSMFAMLMLYVTVPPLITVDGERAMFRTTPLPLQLAGLWCACAGTTPKSHVVRPTIAKARRRSVASRRPPVRLFRIPFLAPPWIAPAATTAAANVRPRLTRGLDMTTPLRGCIRLRDRNRREHMSGGL